MMGSSPTGSTPLAGSSPGSWGSGAHPALLGTSPPSGGHGVDGKTPSAKKFWSRIMYDVALDSSEFQVRSASFQLRAAVPLPVAAPL